MVGWSSHTHARARTRTHTLCPLLPPSGPALGERSGAQAAAGGESVTHLKSWRYVETKYISQERELSLLCFVKMKHLRVYSTSTSSFFHTKLRRFHVQMRDILNPT